MLKGKTVLMIGRGSGIARGIAQAALDADGKGKLVADLTEQNPARRIGTAQDMTSAAVLALTNTFMTGLTLHVDGGERLI
jgi:NAD(P)-dependent dehydrogenase (short-subunit alcohol dehydrogenase family)